METRLFGSIEIDESQVITFPDGLPGFEDLTRFVLVILEQTRPFLWLQALDRDIALPLVSPFDVEREYAPHIDDVCLASLELKREEDLLVFAVAVIPSEVRQMTANLAAPILINIDNNRGCQAMVADEHYPVRQPIYEAVRSRVQAAEHDGLERGADRSGLKEDADRSGLKEDAGRSGLQEECAHAGHHETAQ